jgi:hypothetical protein
MYIPTHGIGTNAFGPNIPSTKRRTFVWDIRGWNSIYEMMCHFYIYIYMHDDDDAMS